VSVLQGNHQGCKGLIHLQSPLPRKRIDFCIEHLFGGENEVKSTCVVRDGRTINRRFGEVRNMARAAHDSPLSCSSNRGSSSQSIPATIVQVQTMGWSLRAISRHGISKLGCARNSLGTVASYVHYPGLEREATKVIKNC